MGSRNTGTQGTGVPIVSNKAIRDLLRQRKISLDKVGDIILALVHEEHLQDKQGEMLMGKLLEATNR